MFDNFQDFKNDFVNICKTNNFKIINMNDDELIISINLHLLTNNSINLTLKFKEISQKEQIQFLLKDLNDKNKKIDELNIKINELENGHKSLEKIINNLLLRIQKFENKLSLKACTCSRGSSEHRCCLTGKCVSEQTFV